VDARETLETAAAIGMRVEPLTLAGIVGRPIEREIAAAFDAGLLRAEGYAIAFRHAAVQAVIVAATSPVRAQLLHNRILAYLERHPGSGASASRLAFHAEEAGNRTAAHRYALTAAAEATRLQSHREAADQYARALRCADTIPPQANAEILEAHAYACHLTSRMPDAIASQQAAADIWDTLGNRLRYGHNLRRLSRYWLYDGRYRIGGDLAEESFESLQAFPDSAEFAMACGFLAEWRIRAARFAEARALADRAMAIANRLDDPATIAHALISAGMVQLALNDPAGTGTLDAGGALARQIGHDEFEFRAISHLAEANVTRRLRAESRSYASAGLEMARTRDLPMMIALYGSVRLMTLLDGCDWPAAIEESATLIANGGAAGRLVLIAHLVAARAGMRSGQGGPSALDPAIRHAHALDDPVAWAMVRSAQLEQAWLAGTSPGDTIVPGALLADAHAAGDAWTASELALWQSRSGPLPAVPEWVVEPYSSELRGDLPKAADLWVETGVPIEALRARSASDLESELRAAHAGFIALGAEPDAIRVARRMHELGYRGIPRGPRPSTRQNAALLSRREIDVLTLLAEGASNREIADRLSVSPKTVDHHVSAILAKLGASNRQQAVVKSREIGVLPI
jgi:DNA-binding CsgD family transcriptional regulator/tetratricopeptide (TPR) repeat protein